MAAKKSKPKAERKDCCPVLTLALEQAYSHKGLATAMLMTRPATGEPKITHAPVIYFKRVPRGHKYEGASCAPVEFCPFCGKKQSPEEEQTDG